MTMSSREIAELTGKRHDHVLRDVKRMLEDLEEDLPKFGAIYRDEKNREYPEYRLPKDLSICLVAGYDAKLRLTIIRRWEELETKAPPPAPTDPSAPRLAAMEAAIMDLTRLVGELVNRPVQVALPAPAKGPQSFQ